MSAKKKSSPKISFGKEPLTEVVCGIQFKMLPKFTVGHLGKLWESYKEKYDSCREQPALVSPVEPIPGQPPSDIKVVPTLMPRTVFVASDQGSVIQVQRDAFYFNWQKGKPEIKYPHFEEIYSKFMEEFGKFTVFVKKEDLGDVSPIQFEISYYNEIPIVQDGKQILKDVYWSSEPRFLAPPENITLTASFLLPDCLGRLHSVFRNIVNLKNEPVYQWSLTARGACNPRTEMHVDKMDSWFASAKEYITESFVDLSTDEYQKDVWKRES